MIKKKHLNIKFQYANNQHKLVNLFKFNMLKK